MTLVVSKIINGKFINISDSQTIVKDILTQKEEPNPDSFDGVVKTIIVNQRMCVSYAGFVYYANQVLKKLLIPSWNLSLKELTDIFIKSNIESNDKTHYLLGFIRSDKQIIQCKISDGKLVDYTNSLLWLGDYRAFQVYEKNFNELIALDDKNDEVDCMKKAFNIIIQEKTLESVDNFQITVQSNDKGKVAESVFFEYGMRVETSLNKPITIKFQKSKEWTAFPVNTDKDLTGYSIFTSFHTTKFGFAIYDIERKSGVLFYPQLKLGMESFEVIKGKNIQATYQNFIDEIWKKYELPLKGFVWLSEGIAIQLIDNVPKHLKK